MGLLTDLALVNMLTGGTKNLSNSGSDYTGNGLDKKLRKIGEKTMKAYGIAFTKGRFYQSSLIDMCDKSKMFVDSLKQSEKDKIIASIEQSLKIEKPNNRYTVKIKPLQSVNNVPVIVNRDTVSRSFGKYEPVLILDELELDHDKAKIERMYSRLVPNGLTHNIYSEEIYRFGVDKDDFGYYIDRVTRDCSGRVYRTYFLPSSYIINKEVMQWC